MDGSPAVPATVFKVKAFTRSSEVGFFFYAGFAAVGELSFEARDVQIPIATWPAGADAPVIVGKQLDAVSLPYSDYAVFPHALPRPSWWAAGG